MSVMIYARESTILLTIFWRIIEYYGYFKQNQRLSLSKDFNDDKSKLINVYLKKILKITLNKHILLSIIEILKLYIYWHNQLFKFLNELTNFIIPKKENEFTVIAMFISIELLVEFLTEILFYFKISKIKAKFQVQEKNSSYLSLFCSSFVTSLILNITVVKLMGYYHRFYEKVFFITFIVLSLSLIYLFQQLNPGIYLLSKKILEEGELRENITELVKNLKFEVNQIFISDFSDNRINFLFEFDKNKLNYIVINTSIIKILNKEEILGLISHEIGHEIYSDSKIKLINKYFTFMIIAWIYCQTMKSEYFIQSFGLFQGTDIQKIFLFLLYIKPIYFILIFIQYFIYKNQEILSDEYSIKLGFGEQLFSALCKISFLHPQIGYERLYAAIFVKKATIIDRINFIDYHLKKLK